MLRDFPEMNVKLMFKKGKKLNRVIRISRIIDLKILLPRQRVSLDGTVWEVRRNNINGTSFLLRRKL